MNRNLIAVTVLLALAGCGSGTDSSPRVADEPLTHEQVVRKVRAVCAQAFSGDVLFRREVQDSLETGSFDNAAASLEDRAGLFAQAVSDLGAVRPPTADRDAVGRFRRAIAGEQRITADYATVIEDAARNSTGSLAEEVKAIDGKAVKLRRDLAGAARDLGVRGCPA